MEELLVKISEILDMSIDGLQVAYPVLKHQYIWYRILESVHIISFVLAVVLTGAVIIGLVLCYDIDFLDEDKVNFYRKILIVVSIIIVISTLIALGTAIAQLTLSTDLMLLKELL